MLTNLIIWILVGALAGWLARRVVRGHDFDFVRSIVVGLIGALVGGWLFGQLGIHLGGGIIGEMIVAFVGAVVLLVVVRWLSRVI